MTDIMSRSVDSISDASWHPALRPERTSAAEDTHPVPNLAVNSQELSISEEGNILPVKSTDSEQVPFFHDQSTAAQNDRSSKHRVSFVTPEASYVDLSREEGTSLESSEHTGLSESIQEVSKSDETAVVESQRNEFSWGDEAEASWDLTSSTDPFQRPDVIERTNSFPAVPQDSQAKSEGGLEERGSDNMEIADLHRDGLKGEDGQSQEPFWEDSQLDDGENGGDEFFGQLKTQTKPIYMPPESESRFEEGLPLVHEEAETPVEPTVTSEAALENVFDGDGDDADEFFKSTGQDISASTSLKPPHITRKSTSQVLDSINFTAPDSPVDDFFDKALQNDAAPEEKSHAEDVPVEDDLAARWQAELSDDDDLLLDDGNNADQVKPTTSSNETLPNPDVATQITEASSLQYQPPAAPVQTKIYTPHQPSTTELTQGLPAGSYFPSPSYTASPYTASQPQARPTSAEERAQSFVNQSKEGYKSPYDLPENLARPRRQPASRRSMQTLNSAFQATPLAPPARSSSVAATSALPESQISPGTVPPPEPKPVVAPKNFYEELPLPKQRPSSSGRYAPRSTTAPPQPIPSVPSQPPLPTSQTLPPQPVTAANTDNSYQSQLQAPETMGIYSNLPVPNAAAAPAANSRYSPKPPGLAPGAKPQANARYSPAPPPPSSTSPVRNRYASQPAATLPFQPRTSSPLAQHEKNAYVGSSAQAEQESPSASTILPPRRSSSQLVQESPLLAQSRSLGPPAAITSPPISQPPTSRYAPNTSLPQAPQSQTESPYAPSSLDTQARSPPTKDETNFAPPRRSQTQSPGRQMISPTLAPPTTGQFQRPASVHAPGSPTKSTNPYAAVNVSTAPREPVQELIFIPPTDGQQLDPLERWKGAPIFKFGFGGLVATCFPQHIPRYAAGQMAPMIKAMPGEPHTKHLKDVVSPINDIVRFPGPLRSKSKKKEVVAWLSSKIAAFENEGVPLSLQGQVDSYKRHEEKVLLWRVVRILVEHDGTLEGTPEIQKAVRAALSPGLQPDEGQTGFNGDPLGSGLYQPQVTSVQSDGVDPQFFPELKNDLLNGEREKAVWSAVDRRLWGHAMLLSSTLDRSVWKQVIQEFVRREVRSAGDNMESLAALYEIFAGNMEESVDELVPPSARAGLQMMSKSTGQGPARNALDGLDRWRDTLGLVTSNRSGDDYRALLNLGQLLFHYGRVEAAHVCFLFARASPHTPVFGGVDDPQSSIVLLGADHRHFPATFARDEDAVTLTEVYEFATSILAGHAGSVLPHLQAFKVQQATSLADKGLKSEAQQYCDAVAGILKASTRPSPYYHPRLLAELEELTTRVRQAPSDGSSSWISKPSMEKVSGSMWAKFNSFIAGDDSDAASTGSGKMGDGDVGPFAKVTGTPTISRPPSASDHYGSYPIAQPASNTASRYAPVNQYALGTSPEQPRGRSSFEQQMSPPVNIPYAPRRGSQEPHTPSESSPYFPANLGSQGSPSAFFHQSTPPHSSYTPLAPVEEDSGSQLSQSEHLTSQLTTGLQAHAQTFGQPLPSPPSNEVTTSKTSGYEPPAAGYEPPTNSYGYEPPSYEPDLPTPVEEEDESAEEKKPKKKSFMDDDDEDDIAARAAALKAEKARKDREADEAFRKAAEADAQRGQQAGAKKGWFGGWFAGKKEGESSGPIRAKLGEENSFYYDPELKKWVNKKDPNSATASARATPPPPKAPSRSTTPASVPPTGGSRPQSSGDSPSLTNGIGAPPSAPSVPPRAASATGAAVTPPGSSSSMAAPPRPATSLSQASSIDDLIGAPQARKGNTMKGKKKGRGYVDVMAK